MNKKLIVVLSVLTGIILVALGFYTFQTRNVDQEAVSLSKNFIETSDEAKIKDYLSRNFLEKISENTSVNPSSYESAVKDYQTESKITKTKTVSQSTNNSTLEVTVESTTRNTKTGFETKSTSIYTVVIVKEGDSWKIDDFQLKENLN